MIYYDFHIHSALSPCGDKDMTPNNIVNMAAISGLDTIAVSDHNTVGNVRSAIEAGKLCGVNVIPGMEVETSEEVHILTLYPSIEIAEDVAKEIKEKAHAAYKAQEELFGDDIREVERVIMLRSVDRRWMDHIDAMDQLKRGISLRAYAQKDPVIAFREESFDMFDEMTNEIREGTVDFVLKARIRKEEPVERKQTVKITSTSVDSGLSQSTARPRHILSGLLQS